MHKQIHEDPDDQVSAMCHRNHVERAYLYEQEEAVPDAEYEQVQAEAKSGPVIHIFGGSEQETSVRDCELVRNDTETVRMPTIRQVKRVLGAMGRWGAGLVFLCGVADGLIDTTYGLMLTIVCIGWGLLHLLQGVAHG